MDARVQIQIVTWNSRNDLARLFEGINIQDHVLYKVLIIDNASEDATLGWLQEYEPNVARIENKENIGFARAHNQGFALCTAPYVLVLNPDTQLQADFLKEAVEAIESDQRIASVGGKMYRELPKEDRSGILDSCGLKLRITGQVVDRGQNKRARGKYMKQQEVFGITGGCVLYRRTALKSIRERTGIFDERFEMYKEDVDLAWRLRRSGWKALYTPRAIAWHRRTVSQGERNRRTSEEKLISLRNHLLLLGKNISKSDWWRMPFITLYELIKFMYVALFETSSLQAYVAALRTAKTDT